MWYLRRAELNIIMGMELNNHILWGIYLHPSAQYSDVP